MNIYQYFKKLVKQTIFTIYTVALIFRHIHCLHLMNSEVALVLESSGNQVHPQIIFDPH